MVLVVSSLQRHGSNVDILDAELGLVSVAFPGQVKSLTEHENHISTIGPFHEYQHKLPISSSLDIFPHTFRIDGSKLMYDPLQCISDCFVSLFF